MTPPRDPPDLDALERRVARMLESAVGDDGAWTASVEEGLRRSAGVRQRRRQTPLKWTIGRGPRLLALGLTAVAAIALVAVIVRWPAGPPAPGGPRIGASPPVAVAMDPLVLTRLRVPPFEPAAAVQYEGSLWMTTLGGQIHELDPVTGETVGGGGLPGNACDAISVAAGFLWMPSCASGPGQSGEVVFLTQVDPATGSVVRTVELPEGAGAGTGELDGEVWVIADTSAGTLLPIDPARGTTGSARRLGVRATHIVAQGGALWLSLADASAVIRYDPASDAETARIAVDGAPEALLAADDGVWVAVRGAKVLAHISASDGAIDRIAPIGENAVQLQGVGTTVWVLTRSEILSVDAATGDVTRRIAVGEHAVSFAPQFVGATYVMAAGEDLWFVPPRGEMLRLRIR